LPEQKNVSPLLDGITMGNPISEHKGVVCCPAVKENSDKKYIVKIISIPATQAQLDALLLAGAYKDPADAMEYFRGVGEDILKEAELLKMLSKLEGFLPYDGWQMEPITRRRLGYEIYLVGSYKRSLDKFMRKNPVTHLQAINLGLDLCAALSVSRQAGYLYVDLKPGNIYVSEKKDYRIGDLGFMSLDALRYSSLPDRYYSPYTPPELFDPMTSVNLTADTYGVGMILYQLYNDGHLPFTEKAPDTELPAPVNADYEIAEIILKAVHPDPACRWDDPREMGKALAAYMQRNSVNDVPITSFTPLDVKPEDIVVIRPKKNREPEETAQIVAEDDVPEAEPQIGASEKTEQTAETDAEELPEKTEEAIEITAVEMSEEITPVTEEAPPETEAVTSEEPLIQTEEAPAAEPEIPVSTETEEAEITAVFPETEAPETVIPETEVPETNEPEENNVFSGMELSEELSRIIDHADDLIAHQIPDEAVFPEEPPAPDLFAFIADDVEETDDSDIPEEPLMEEAEEPQKSKKKKKQKHFENPERKKKIRKFFSSLLTILLLCIMGTAGYWYYQNVYLQTIDAISVDGTQDQITVLVDTGVEESRLRVTCSDSYGKVHTQYVSGGKATFTELIPSTLYTVKVEMDGFHKLVGKTTDVFTTEATTRILSFVGVAGSEDGSVQLNFTVEGKEPDFWNILYTAEGEDIRRETVTGHSATVTGLTVGKVYSFTLDGGNNFDLSGETELQYLASRIILAEDLVVTSENGSDITVHWNTPGDAVVENWNVRCYNDYGYEQQVNTAENQAMFTEIDPAEKYTIEITASGMTHPAKTSISADPINISAFHIDESKHTELNVTWDYTGSAPEGGWMLIYTVDGSSNQIIKCDQAEASISPLVPGAKYQITLLSADDRSIFNNSTSCQTASAEVFSENNFNVADVAFDLLKTPEDANWRAETADPETFTTSFSAGDSVSIAMRSASVFYLPGSEVKVLFVYRDSYGNTLPELMVLESHYWNKLWNAGDTKNGELSIPKLPSNPGSYVLELYFNGCTVATFDIDITS